MGESGGAGGAPADVGTGGQSRVQRQLQPTLNSTVWYKISMSSLSLRVVSAQESYHPTPSICTIQAHTLGREKLFAICKEVQSVVLKAPTLRQNALSTHNKNTDEKRLRFAVAVVGSKSSELSLTSLRRRRDSVSVQTRSGCQGPWFRSRPCPLLSGPLDRRVSALN